jgi:CheY-like chemotaxis protein
MPDLIDAYLPDSPQADQLLGCLKKLSPRAPLTALVIDNSQEARQSLRTLLEDFHLDVIEAETAEAAVHLIAERQPALVFTDVILPDYSGTGLVTRLLETFKDGSLVIHSSQVFTNEERDFLRRHATMLIRKGPAVDSVYRTALIHAIAGARRRQSSS